jgi:hypothetical protein
MINPEVIKILPYRGRNNEIAEGRKTVIKLYEDGSVGGSRFEYSVKYTECVKITMGHDEDAESIESVSYNEEDGVMDKASIIGIVKYIKTSYTEEMEPYNINYVDVCSVGNSLTFSVENEEDRNNLYSKIYKWKYS